MNIHPLTDEYSSVNEMNIHLWNRWIFISKRDEYSSLDWAKNASNMLPWETLKIRCKSNHKISIFFLHAGIGAFPPMMVAFFMQTILGLICGSGLCPHWYMLYEGLALIHEGLCPHSYEAMLLHSPTSSSHLFALGLQSPLSLFLSIYIYVCIKNAK